MTLQERAVMSTIEHYRESAATVASAAFTATLPYQEFLDGIGRRLARSIAGHSPDCSCELCKIEFDINEALGFTTTRETNGSATRHAEAAAAPDPHVH